MKLKIMFTFSILTVLTMGILFADTPYEIVSDLTGADFETCYELRQSGMTYGEIAEEYGVYDEFYDAMLLEKEARLEVLVSNGTLTQEEAEAMLLNCDPTNPQYQMQAYGMGYGRIANEDGTFTPGSGMGFGVANEYAGTYGAGRGMMGRFANGTADGTGFGQGGGMFGGNSRWSDSNE